MRSQWTQGKLPGPPFWQRTTAASVLVGIGASLFGYTYVVYHPSVVEAALAFLVYLGPCLIGALSALLPDDHRLWRWQQARAGRHAFWAYVVLLCGDFVVVGPAAQLTTHALNTASLVLLLSLVGRLYAGRPAQGAAPWTADRVLWGKASLAMTLAAISVFGAARHSMHGRLHETPLINVYRALRWTPAPDQEAPFLRGRIIVVEIRQLGPRLHKSHYRLPSSLRATIPSEVGTVVGARCYSEKIGKYVYTRPGTTPTDTGLAAYQSACEVTIAHVATGWIFPRRNFVGSEPPRERAFPLPGRGSDAMDQLLNYIQQLPRMP